jgi:hypothetical protein
VKLVTAGRQNEKKNITKTNPLNLSAPSSSPKLPQSLLFWENAMNSRTNNKLSNFKTLWI